MNTFFKTLALFCFVFLTNAISAQDVSFSQTTNEGCGPLEVVFTNQSVVGDYYVWTVHDNQGPIFNVQQEDFTYNFNSPGHFQVELAAYSSIHEFLGSYYGYVKINGADDFWMSTGLQVCPGEKIFMRPESSYSWVLWDLGDGTTANFDSPHISFPDPGNYNITMYIDAFCGIDTVVKTIEVTNSAIPNVSFFVSGNNTFCPNDEIEFYADCNAEEYHWDFDDGSTSSEQNPVYSYQYPGSKVVTLTATNLCGNSNSTSNFVHIETNLFAEGNFNIDQSTVCPGEIVGFNAHGTGSYAWDFGDGGTSTLKRPQYIYSDEDVYTVTLTVTNGCGNSDTQSQSFDVHPDPTQKPDVYIRFASYEYENSDTIVLCPNEQFTIENHSDKITSLSIEWNRGDGTKSYEKDLTYQYTSPGLYEITLTATNICTGQDSVKKWVNVDATALPDANIATLQDTICPGELMYFADMGSDYDNLNNVYSIWFGNGDSLVNQTEFAHPEMTFFTYQYNEVGEYDYIFTVTNLCGNTLEHTGTLVVDSDPNHSTFYYVENSTESGWRPGGCHNDPVEFIAIGGISYVWHFGDGETSIDSFAYHTYSDTGMYNAFVIITNGCGVIDTIFSPVEIGSTSYPEPWFESYPYDRVCAGDSIEFDYSGHGYDIDNLTCFWDFGDGNFSTIPNPSHSYETGGEYMVKFVVSNGCGSDSSYRFVHVDQPFVDFSASSTTVLAAEEISFTNLSSGASSFLWEFGDGTTSTETSPSHSWNWIGFYDVSLTATSVSGCSTTLTHENYIVVSTLQIAGENIGNVVCNGDNSGYIDIAITGGYPPYSCFWSNGYVGEDIYNLSAGSYTVTVQDNLGIFAIETYEIVEYSALTGTLSATDPGCFGESTGSITANITGGLAPYNYVWSNGANTSSISNIPSNFYELTVTDAMGCSIAKSTSVFDPVEGWPTLYTDNASCGGSNGLAHVADVGNYSGAYSCVWGTSPTQTTNLIENLEAGIYPVTVTYGGCVEVLYAAVNESSGPIIDFVNTNNVPVCPGETNAGINLGVSGSGPFTFAWSNGATGAGIVGLGAGEYFATITDNSGCKSFVSQTIEQIAPMNPQFIANDPTCYGGYDGNLTVLPGNSSWYYEYLWSNGSISNTNIYRPAGTYSVTITDADGCEATASAQLFNPPQISIVLNTTNVNLYSDGIISAYVENGTPPYTYEWSNNGWESTQIFLTPGEYSVTVTDANGCTATNSATVTEPAAEIVNITASGSTTFCYGSSVTLDAGSGFNGYQWSNGDLTQTTTVYESGTYYVTVLGDESYGTSSIDVEVIRPYSEQEICLVTADVETGHNVIAWEKPVRNDIVSFNIYKETTVAYQYELLATIPYDDLSGYLDEESDPNVQSYRYKISVVDTCGNESELSDAHKTMHLTVSTGLGVYNLIWEDYEGFDFGSYLIYRGTTPDNLMPYSAIASSITTYTDYASILPYYYQIAVLKEDTCYLTGGAKDVSGPYSQSVSNLEDNGISVDVSDLVLGEKGMHIYPNPTRDFVNIKLYGYENSENNEYQIHITDIAGKVIYSSLSKGSSQTIDLRNYSPGVYFVEVISDITLRDKLIIE
ncbi:MAG: PKD domain-containing protein [Bacteroidales bacterium]|nr:PKD domain-containing protein [Bacteroidales bacterium]